MWVPELVFGHLLTGSNFDDDADADDADHPSESADGDSERVPQKGLSQRGKAAVAGGAAVASVGSKGALSLSAGDVAALRRRAVEVAALVGPKGVTVHFNGSPLPVRSLGDLASLFVARPPDGEADSDGEVEGNEDSGAMKGGSSSLRRSNGVVSEGRGSKASGVGSSGGRWEVAAVASSALRVGGHLPGDGGGCVSFVNGVATSRGGSHANHVTNQVVAFEAAQQFFPGLGAAGPPSVYVVHTCM
jgi:hypothetical protein